MTPEEVWLREQQPELFRNAVQQAIENSHDLLNSNALIYTDNMIKGKIPFSFLPWRLISLGKWINIFNIQ